MKTPILLPGVVCEVNKRDSGVSCIIPAGHADVTNFDNKAVT